MNSKMNATVKGNRAKEVKKEVTNFMGGISYTINPLDILKMVTASSIFGEPAYYRNGAFAEKKITDGTFSIHNLIAEYSVLSLDKYKGMTTSALMEKIIDDALNFDYKAVLDWAVELRQNFYMRLNPQIIMVRAALHDKREQFTQKNAGYFGEIQNKVMSRGDDVISQVTYILYLNGGKNKIPNILKRTWAKKVSSLSRYELYKYRTHGIGLIDTIRICHAKGVDIDELMKTGTLQMDEQNKTWEVLHNSDGKTWAEILQTIKMPHMALLRNLRNIFTEIDNLETAKEVMKNLENGVIKGKQFPYRYLTSYNAVKGANNINHKMFLMDSLEECMDVSCQNLPTLAGKNAFLSDNSGSAWGTCPSEYGSMTVAKIGNLSSVIGAANSEEGYVFPFGDKLKEYAVSKRQGILHQAEEVNKLGSTVGGGTECGVWLFFDKAIKEKIHWDNIFIYSDMQAGHGGLYGTDSACKMYKSEGYAVGNSHYIDVMKLIDTYRKTVNPKVNVFCIQTAGYENVLVPEYAYRCNILYGWTGKELVFADAMNKFWDEKDAKSNVV